MQKIVLGGGGGCVQREGSSIQRVTLAVNGEAARYVQRCSAWRSTWWTCSSSWCDSTYSSSGGISFREMNTCQSLVVCRQVVLSLTTSSPCSGRPASALPRLWRTPAPHLGARELRIEFPDIHHRNIDLFITFFSGHSLFSSLIYIILSSKINI